MKRSLTFALILTIIYNAGLFAQEDSSDNGYYLFDSFTEGTVYYKDGRQFQIPLNYHVIGECFLFLDQNDENKIKEFGEPGLIVLIKVEDRAFRLNGKTVQEIVQSEPLLLVEYRAKIKDKGKKSAYGGYSQTSAIENRSGIFTSEGYHKLNTEEPIAVSKLEKTYYATHNKKEKRFFNEKTFLKIFSENKEPISKFIDDNKVDFNDINQVIQLYNYAVSL